MYKNATELTFKKSVKVMLIVEADELFGVFLGLKTLKYGHHAWLEVKEEEWLITGREVRGHTVDHAGRREVRAVNV